MENHNFDCPICSKSFAASAIEAHASSCLFLNERSNVEAQNFLKRPRPDSQAKDRSPTVNKKVKRPNGNSQMILTSPIAPEKPNLLMKEQTNFLAKLTPSTSVS